MCEDGAVWVMVVTYSKDEPDQFGCCVSKSWSCISSKIMNQEGKAYGRRLGRSSDTTNA